MKRFIFLLIGMVSCLFLMGCGAEIPEKDSEKIKVVATIFPPYDFVRQIAGDAVELQMLLSPGTESHYYSPTLSDVSDIHESDLFLYVGGTSDTWVADILAVADSEKLHTMALLDVVTPLEEEIVEGMEQEQHAHESDHDHDFEYLAYDEHVWTSPKNAILIVQAICEKLCELDRENAELFRSNTERYLKDLQLLDAEYTELCGNAQRDTLVFAERFPFRYFAHDYNLRYYAAFQGCSSQNEPTLSTIGFLVDKIQEEKIPVVFYIEFSDMTVADRICEETGCKKLLFHSCHNVVREDFEKGVTYLDLMKTNLLNLREALNGNVVD